MYKIQDKCCVQVARAYLAHEVELVRTLVETIIIEKPTRATVVATIAGAITTVVCSSPATRATIVLRAAAITTHTHLQNDEHVEHHEQEDHGSDQQPERPK